jgi:hypothetical protein
LRIKFTLKILKSGIKTFKKLIPSHKKMESNF